MVYENVKIRYKLIQLSCNDFKFMFPENMKKFKLMSMQSVIMDKFDLSWWDGNMSTFEVFLLL